MASEKGDGFAKSRRTFFEKERGQARICKERSTERMNLQQAACKIPHWHHFYAVVEASLCHVPSVDVRLASQKLFSLRPWCAAAFKIIGSFIGQLKMPHTML